MGQEIIDWIKASWRAGYLLYSAAVCTALVLYFRKRTRPQLGAQAAITWGSIAFSLLLFFFLGAADDTKQFLTLFGFGAVGAALGYLTGVALAPSSLSEENRFMKAQNLLATLLAGVFGTKLLSLWDALTKEPNPLLFQPAYYLPLLSGLVGYFVALAAFYTLRSVTTGQVRITAPAAQFVAWTDSNQKRQENGVAASAAVQFTGAADFSDDMSVMWELKPKDGQTQVPAPAPGISAAGLLTAPDAAWIAAHPAALDWNVVATSNRDRSKYASCDVHFVGV